MPDYYNSPRWSGEITDCSMPMTFDQYSFCSYNCLYCFSIYQKSIGVAKKNYLLKVFRSVNIEKVKKIFNLETNSQFNDLIKDKKVLQWGGLADPFCNLEKKYGVGLELLKYFKEKEYPIRFSTKGTWWVDDDRYKELFRDTKYWNVLFSIITLNEDLAAFVERGVDSPKKRLEAMEKCVKLNGGGVTLRLRPFIIQVSNPTYKQLIKDAASAGATALSVEFFCLEARSVILKENLRKLARIINFDTVEYYKKYSSQKSGYMRLNRNVKRDFMYDMKRIAEENGMRFYVSDAHFKEMCANGSCCGLSEDYNYCRGQFTEALLIAKKKGYVYWKDIKKDLLYAKKIRYLSMNGFNKGSSENMSKYVGYNVYDWIQYQWNNIKSGQNPYRYFEGILVPKGRDKDNNLIYYYNKDRE